MENRGNKTKYYELLGHTMNMTQLTDPIQIISFIVARGLNKFPNQTSLCVLGDYAVYFIHGHIRYVEKWSDTAELDEMMNDERPCKF